MNSLAPPGGIVIGERLYEKVKHIQGYIFSELIGAQIFTESRYQIYTVKREEKAEGELEE
jgi:hypothetical protein